MTEHHLEVTATSGKPLRRREFVRRATLLALGAAATPLLAACEESVLTPTRPAPVSPPPANTPTRDAVAQAAETSSPVPAVSTTVSTQPPSATQPEATPTQPEATATEPLPTETPQPTPTSPPPRATPTPTVSAAIASGQHSVALLAGTDRATAVPAVLDMLGFGAGWLRGKHVALKANFNSADPPPGSTHLDTLRALLKRLQDWGAAKITMVERSGMGDTRQVLRQRGVNDLAAEFGVDLAILDDLPASEWVNLKGAHWRRGFLFPRVVQEADAVVQTCCLKTHRFGGHFTMSLKNSVGLVAKYDPSDGYNYMSELHGSASQRLMIAEINAAYSPALVLLDGVVAFVSGGPDQGRKAQAGLFLAGRDRVAVDAVGVAMLRNLGTTAEVSRGTVFSQPQISRAVALGVGAPNAGAISLHPAGDEASRKLAGTLQQLLAA